MGRRAGSFGQGPPWTRLGEAMISVIFLWRFQSRTVTGIEFVAFLSFVSYRICFVRLQRESLSAHVLGQSSNAAQSWRKGRSWECNAQYLLVWPWFLCGSHVLYLVDSVSMEVRLHACQRASLVSSMEGSFVGDLSTYSS